MRLINAQAEKRSKISQSRTLVESIIPPQLSSAIIGETVQKILRGSPSDSKIHKNDSGVEYVIW